MYARILCNLCEELKITVLDEIAKRFILNGKNKFDFTFSRKMHTVRKGKNDTNSDNVSVSYSMLKLAFSRRSRTLNKVAVIKFLSTSFFFSLYLS